MFKTQINRLLIVVCVINLCFFIGCHRSYYRRQADSEAQRLVSEKAVDPRWNTSDGTIDIDPQSRMFNPFSQDHPPIPPDDASSHQLMHRVDGKEGYPHWHANGDTDAVENPDWKSYLPVNEDGQVVLTLERAYQLALLHSPDLQQQYETLYRSALAVSLQRFGFDSQLFSGFNSFATTQGRIRGGGSSTSTIQNQIGANGAGANLQRLGVTGTNFAVGLANTILFNLAGPNTQSATTLIDFSIIQPLLRGAGRERIMESLTQSERTLLANVRQIERFKRGFYLNVAIGRNAGSGATLAANFLNNPGFGSDSTGGFYGLLLQQQTIRNQELNVRQLEGILGQFQEFFDKNRLSAVNLKQFENNVYGQQRGLLQQRVTYQNSLDAYKVQLGLPPDLDVIIDDSYLDRFELISDQINDRLISIAKLREQMGDVLNLIYAEFDDIDKPGFVFPKNLNAKVALLEPFVEQAEATLDGILNEDATQLGADFDKLDAARNGRIEYLQRLATDVRTGRIASDVDPSLFVADSVPEADELRSGLGGPTAKSTGDSPTILERGRKLKLEIAETRAKIDNFAQTEQTLGEAELKAFIEEEFQQQIPGELAEMNNLTLEMTLLQAFARSNSIEIINISIDDEQAIRIARCMRRDWMNARASLVDEYRNIEFVADQLEAGVDLVLQGNIGNVGDNPVKLRYENGQLRAGFRIDAPITRLAERNQYRGALISYQQSRRQFYQFEDSIKQNLRQLLRNVNRSKVLFELDRRTVQASIENVEINRLELERPVGAGANSSSFGNTIAQDLNRAIDGLNSAQNSFLRTWVQYEVLRRNLDFDMGTMMLDEMGQWRDPGEIDSSIGVRAAAVMGFEPDCQFCENIGTSYQPQLTEEELENMDSVLTESGSGKVGFDVLDLIQRPGRDEAQQAPLDAAEQRRRLQKQIELERQIQLQEIERERLELQQRDQELQLEQLRQQQLPRPNSGLLSPRTPNSPMQVSDAEIRSANRQFEDQPRGRTFEYQQNQPVSGASADGGFVRPVVAPIQSVPLSFSPDQSSLVPANQENVAPQVAEINQLVSSVRVPPVQTRAPLQAEPTGASMIRLAASTSEDRQGSSVNSATKLAVTSDERQVDVLQMTSLPEMKVSSIEPIGDQATMARTSAAATDSRPSFNKEDLTEIDFELRQRASLAIAGPPPVEMPTQTATGMFKSDLELATRPAAKTEPILSVRNRSSSEDKESFEWQQTESTFGGLLNRFKK